MHMYPIIPLFWLIFTLYWGVTAVSTKKSEWRQGFGTELIHRIPLTVGLMIMFFPIARGHFRMIPLAQVAGDVICGLGLLVAIWSRRTLADNWSGNVTLKVDHELVERGPYQFVRHPIYTGILLMVIGAAIAYPHWSSLFGLPIAFIGFWLKLKQEEVVMLNHFGQKYEDYRHRVKALIPAVL
jgi:protein-S-isoprenylcysteine O-methyltransferase Ste14